MKVQKEKYQTTEFLVERLKVLNEHAKKAFRLQQIGSIVAFVAVLVGICLTYFGKIEIAIVQSISTIAISIVTYLFYTQSNRANDDVNKFALVSIKFNEAWNIVETGMQHAGYISDVKSRDEAVQKIIERQLELVLSDELWRLQLDLQKAPSKMSSKKEEQIPDE